MDKNKTDLPPVYRNIVFLTGAGISAPSGLATFRSQNGLWNNHRMEDVATKEAFERCPEQVHAFVNSLKPEFFAARPNTAHLAITKLQQIYPANVSVLTQNIDTLHEQARTKNVYHIHGQINQAKCLQCGHIMETWEDVGTKTVCPACGISGKLKPDVVLFHEPILHEQMIADLLQKADLFIAIGTSGVVYPAAGFAAEAKRNGARTVLLNAEIVTGRNFDEQIIGDAAETLPEFVSRLLLSVKS